MKGIATNDVGIQKDGAPKVSSYVFHNWRSNFGNCAVSASSGISNLPAA